MPVPRVRTIASEAPRAAPARCSARAAALPSLSTNTGRPSRSPITSAKAMSCSGVLTPMTARPVLWSISTGIPKPTASTSASAASSGLRDGVDGDVEDGRLVQTRDDPLRAEVHAEPGVHHSREQFRAAQVDADDAPLRHGVTIRAREVRKAPPAGSSPIASQLRGSMPDRRRDRAPTDDPPYKVYRSPAPGGPDDAGTEERPYTLYRSLPRGLRSRLRGEDESADLERGGDRGGGRFDDGGAGAGGGRRRFWRGPVTWRRALKWVVGLIVAWLLLSVVLFLVSAQIQSGTIPQSAQNALASGGNMITGADTVLVLGTDQRPKGTHEAGANTSDTGSRSDTIMLWRIGGGTSRRLSIPRDTVADIPGHGRDKINAAYAIGGPALTIRTVEGFTGVKINHLIIVNLANFPKFIDDLGGIDVATGRICSNISGGVKNGGFSLFLRPGTHHLTGIQALTLARTRENACNAASNDLTRAGYQQKILNGIKSKLLSPGIFFHLPWASWDAPKAVRTDMGGFTLLSLFVAAEIGGSAPADVLKPAGSTVLPNGGDALEATPGQVTRAVHKLLNG